MPIFEEKLICPLAVRFTQEHIRPIFQNGQDIEETILEIKIKPGKGEYDVILEAPFPSIEIIRWHQKDPEGIEPDAKHWFTLDNRRLYCLQRVAASVWPRRAAVTVEVLYAATDDIRRKDDSSTVGRSVGIGHSLKMLTSRWDWCEDVSVDDRDCTADDDRGVETVLADDKKAGVADLMDAPKALSMLERFLQGEEEVECKTPASPSSEDGTTLPSSPRSMKSSEAADGTQVASEADWLSEGLCGKWRGDKGETYEIKTAAGATWTCVRSGGAGKRKEFELWYDEQSDAVWWGSDWSFFVDAPQVRWSQPDTVCWYGGNDNLRRGAWFTWHKLG